MQLRKLKVSIFEGEDQEDPYGWLHHVERYFVVKRIDEKKDKLDETILYLEGEAFDWYQWEDA